MELSHINEQGRAKMVDVTDKAETFREAIAEGTVIVEPDTMELIKSGGIKKGDVLSVAQVAGIMAAKKTSDMIPMCHPLSLTNAKVSFTTDEEACSITAVCTAVTDGKTGVEMEALTGVSVALLTIYDMCKSVDRRMVMSDIHLVEKTGGKSGDFVF